MTHTALRPSSMSRCDSLSLIRLGLCMGSCLGLLLTLERHWSARDVAASLALQGSNAPCWSICKMFRHNMR